MNDFMLRLINTISAFSWKQAFITMVLGSWLLMAWLVHAAFQSGNLDQIIFGSQVSSVGDCLISVRDRNYIYKGTYINDDPSNVILLFELERDRDYTQSDLVTLCRKLNDLGAKL